MFFCHNAAGEFKFLISIQALIATLYRSDFVWQAKGTIRENLFSTSVTPARSEVFIDYVYIEVED